MCTITINANYVCPTNTHETSADECVSFSGSIPAENDTCPSGYQYLTIISLFGPDTYQCQPISGYKYVCNEGTLINNECYITIDPIAN